MRLRGLHGNLQGTSALSTTRRVVFVPSLGYTVDAFAAAIPRLRSEGVSYNFCLQHGRPGYHEARSAIERLNETPHNLKDLRGTTREGDVWLFSHDLSPKRRELIETLRSHGVATLGLQEGCRPAMGNKYRAVDHVLVWGRQAESRFEGKSTIVGSPRLEKLQSQAELSSGQKSEDVAVINLKIPEAGDYESRTKVWLDAALSAVTSCGLRPLVSKHFFSTTVPTHLDVFEGPIEEALILSRVLISRPSTTVFEAMVLGRQPFLFPFEDDRLCEFHDPCGAFPICWNAKQLSRSLRAHLAGKSAFDHTQFLSDVFDHKPEKPAGNRLADALLAML